MRGRAGSLFGQQFVSEQAFAPLEFGQPGHQAQQPRAGEGQVGRPGAFAHLLAAVQDGVQPGSSANLVAHLEAAYLDRGDPFGEIVIRLWPGLHPGQEIRGGEDGLVSAQDAAPVGVAQQQAAQALAGGQEAQAVPGGQHLAGLKFGQVEGGYAALQRQALLLRQQPDGFGQRRFDRLVVQAAVGRGRVELGPVGDHFVFQAVDELAGLRQRGGGPVGIFAAGFELLFQAAGDGLHGQVDAPDRHQRAQAAFFGAKRQAAQGGGQVGPPIRLGPASGQRLDGGGDIPQGIVPLAGNGCLDGVEKKTTLPVCGAFRATGQAGQQVDQTPLLRVGPGQVGCPASQRAQVIQAVSLGQAGGKAGGVAQAALEIGRLAEFQHLALDSLDVGQRNFLVCIGAQQGFLTAARLGHVLVFLLKSSFQAGMQGPDGFRGGVLGGEAPCPLQAGSQLA